MSTVPNFSSFFPKRAATGARVKIAVREQTRKFCNTQMGNFIHLSLEIDKHILPSIYLWRVDMQINQNPLFVFG